MPNEPTPAELRSILAPIRCFMLDMDGTFYLGDRLLEGSLSFLEKLRETGRTALFVTNNSSKSGRVYVEKLRRMGVTEPFLNVLTSGQTAGRYCMQHFPGKKAFVLGNDLYKAELAAMGLPMDDEAPDYVLIAYDTTLDYAKMTAVCDFVRAGLPYIATHPDLNCPTETGFAPDIGAIMAFIEASAGRRPDLILGKPYSGIVEDALGITGLSKNQLAMVGDRLYTDIATGVNFGMLSVLVLTGESTRQDVASSPVKPALIFERLSDMNPYL
ncbi:MAG: HAD-IIA family hydrolase [Clostridiales bacterium]|nr:HAD-IIA family hydrolase [Clostridiales bacterium]